MMNVATPTVATVSSSDSLVAEISELKAEIAQVKQHLKPHHSTSRTQAGSPAQAHSSPFTPNSDLCWYHQKFGKAAKKYKPPCSQKGNIQACH